MIIREHPCDVSNQRARFYFASSTESKLLKLGKLEVTANDFFWLPDTPLGAHWSIHDANKQYSKAHVHMRLSKGQFRVYPGGQSLGKLIPMQEIPPFSQIKGVIAVGAPHIVWVSVAPILPQLKPFIKPKTTAGTIVSIAFHTGNTTWLGHHFLLVEQNNIDALHGWLSNEKSYEEQRPDIVPKVEYIDLFQAPKCWLASVIAFRYGIP